jgi:hypothetical protein
MGHFSNHLGLSVGGLIPLGYSRVYVHTGKNFGVDEWLRGLKAGRSFVTIGPILFATVNGKLPARRFRLNARRATASPWTSNPSARNQSRKSRSS